MKKVINKILKLAGWELRRIQINNPPPALPCDDCPPAAISRQTMIAGLKWLADNGINVKTVLDIGASNGSWSAECMTFFPKAEYVLFEPQPVHSDALDSFAKGSTQNISLVKKAVGAADGYTYFDAGDPFGGALADKSGENVIKVALTTIDSALIDLKTAGPYLLKLDTHGFEKSILTGASHTLESCEALVIEAYNYRITDEALLFWELCSYLSDKGFRPVDLVDSLYRTYDNSLWQMDLMFVRDTWKGFEYISYK